VAVLVDAFFVFFFELMHFCVEKTCNELHGDPENKRLCGHSVMTSYFGFIQ
jgi:hypothetical protein